MSKRGRKNPSFALALAILFPGAGHLYLGAPRWFFAWLGVHVGLLLLLVTAARSGVAELGLFVFLAVVLLLPLLFLGQLFHCHKLIRTRGREQRRRQQEARRSQRAELEDEIGALKRRVRELEAERIPGELRVGDSFAVEEELRGPLPRKRSKA